MPLYVLDYRYSDPEARARARRRHVDYLTSLLDEGTLVMAGPWADQSGAMVVYRVEDEEQAWSLVDADPYTLEGVTVDRRLREWAVVVGPQAAGRPSVDRDTAGGAGA
jgi:uncharacterized protein YciI